MNIPDFKIKGEFIFVGESVDLFVLELGEQ